MPEKSKIPQLRAGDWLDGDPNSPLVGSVIIALKDLAYGNLNTTKDKHYTVISSIEYDDEGYAKFFIDENTGTIHKDFKFIKDNSKICDCGC